jgi:predicted PurR-regulated permease PerM
VFFALLGGLLAFGLIGVVVGPLALALFLSVGAIERRDAMM